MIEIISYIHATRLILVDCKSFLSSVLDISVVIFLIDLIIIIQDFLDVFPTDQLVLPIGRDIEFYIDHEMGT